MKRSHQPKIAIIHDIFTGYGGGELVAKELATLFPQADIFTTWFTKDNPFYHTLYSRIKKSFSPRNFLYYIKGKNFIKPCIYSYWEAIDLSPYNIVISSSHSYSSKAVLTSPQQLHICYCHTPPKYLYTEYSESGARLSNNVLFHIIFTYLRLIDFVSAQRPDHIIANSLIVQKRIQKYYRRNAIVIYPPVSVPPSFVHYKKNPYFIYVGRLTKAKGLPLIIQTCNKLKKKLIIVGDGDEKHALQKIAGPTIEFKGNVSEQEKNILLQHASAFLFAGIDEDFGIAPVEAMGWGTPVIGYGNGGLSETVIHNKTGILFFSYTEKSLEHAIRIFETTRFSQKNCFIQAKKFSKERFKKNILSLISKKL